MWHIEILLPKRAREQLAHAAARRTVNSIKNAIPDHFVLNLAAGNFQSSSAATQSVRTARGEIDGGFARCPVMRAKVAGRNAHRHAYMREILQHLVDQRGVFRRYVRLWFSPT